MKHKILTYILEVYYLLQRNIKPIFKYSISFTSIAIGFILFFIFLNKISKECEAEKIDKSTSFEVVEIDTNKREKPIVTNDSTISKIATEEISTYNPNTAKVVYDSIQKEIANATNLTINQKRNKSNWYIYLFIIIGLLQIVFTFIFYLRKVRNNNIELYDKDPQQLIEMFKYLQQHIYTIGYNETPRKLKRLSNKIRLQYHLLKNKEYMQTEDDRKRFIRIIYDFQINSQNYKKDILSDDNYNAEFTNVFFAKELINSKTDYRDDELFNHLVRMNYQMMV